MNINPQNNRRPRSGFTLMEMMIVMIVVSIVIAGSIVALSNDSSDEIHTLPLEIERLAKRSLTQAKNERRTQYILISPSHIWQSTDPAQTEPTSESANQFAFPPNCTVSYKRSTDNGWQSVKDKAVWVFSVAGICEGMSIMIELNNSSAELRFHPLTAAIITD